jgi:SNF2 family DNA or RNA helicase
MAGEIEFDDSWEVSDWGKSKGYDANNPPAPKSEPIYTILRSPLPPSRAKYSEDFKVPNYRGVLSADSTEEEILAAIQTVERCGTEVTEAKKFHQDRRTEINKIIDGLNKALANARQFREEADVDAHKLSQCELEVEDKLAWLRGLYIDAITRKKERESLMEELEAYERIKKNSAWGDRIFDYQLDGAKQMVLEKRAILADEMGLGKTLSSIATADLAEAKKVLIITQNDIVSNFSREVSKWSRGRNVIALGTMKTKSTRHFMLNALKEMQEFTVLANYEMWRRDAEIIDILISLQFDTVIVDEAHNMKDDKSNNFKGVKKIVYAENGMYDCGHCGHKFSKWPYNQLCPECYKPIVQRFNAKCSVKRLFLMTGTSILNAPADIWPLLHLLDNVAFPTKRDYLLRYCEQREVKSLTGSFVDRWFFSYGGEKMLQRKLGSKYIRRTREMVGEDKIPPQDEQFHTIRFEEGEYKEQRKVIEQIKKYNQIILNELGNSLDLTSILAILTRSRQAITYPAGIILRDPDTKEPIAKCEVTESIKVDYAEKLIVDFVQNNGQKCVLFSKFTAPLVELERRLNEQGIRAALYCGGIRRERLDEIAVAMDAGFTKKEDCEIDVVLASYAKGSTGLNFTNASQTILLDREWNPSKEDQAEGRTNRIGQTEKSTVHIIEVEGSIDEGISALIQQKSEIITGFEGEAARFSLIEYLERKLNED